MKQKDKNKIISGIRRYSKQQEIIRRILRKHVELSDEKFDEIFSNITSRVDTKCPQSEWNIPHGKKTVYRRRPHFGFSSFFSGNQYFLGSINQPGDWAKWLNLIQLMSAIGIVKIECRSDMTYYSLM